MVATGMWSHVLPAVPDADLAAAIEAVDAMEPDLTSRLARLLRPRAVLSAADLRAVAAGVDALKPPRALRADVLALCGPELAELDAAAASGQTGALRRAAAAVGRTRLAPASAVLGWDDNLRSSVGRALEGAPLSVGELAIKGGGLIGQGILKPGPAVGETMRRLLEWVHEDPTRNDAGTLLEQARAWVET